MSFVQEERSERKLMALTVWACYWYFYELVAILRGLLYQSLVTFVIIVYYYLVLMTVCLFFARFLARLLRLSAIAKNNRGS